MTALSILWFSADPKLMMFINIVFINIVFINIMFINIVCYLCVYKHNVFIYVFINKNI